jgi:hypothetical protein
MLSGQISKGKNEYVRSGIEASGRRLVSILCAIQLLNTCEEHTSKFYPIQKAAKALENVPIPKAFCDVINLVGTIHTKGGKFRPRNAHSLALKWIRNACVFHAKDPFFGEFEDTPLATLKQHCDLNANVGAEKAKTRLTCYPNSPVIPGKWTEQEATRRSKYKYSSIPYPKPTLQALQNYKDRFGNVDVFSQQFTANHFLLVKSAMQLPTSDA